jgi:hypothetical protein
MQVYCLISVPMAMPSSHDFSARAFVRGVLYAQVSKARSLNVALSSLAL